MMRKLFFLLIILIGVGSFVLAEGTKYQLSIHYGINNVFEYGSEDDYVAGENDFPVVPAHTPANFGISFAYFLKDNVGIELEGRFYINSKISLEDPSDKDTVEINASKHYSLTFNLIYQLLKGNLRPYLAVGGGFDKLSAKDETYTSEYGFEIEILAPEKTTNFLAQFGGGVQYFINSSVGARLDVRYVMISDDPNNISSLNVMAGAFIRF